VTKDHSLSSPASEILDYLLRQPDAQDSIEGILRWWVLEECIRKWTPKISDAVAQLVAQGFLEERLTAGGTVLYRAVRAAPKLSQPNSPSSDSGKEYRQNEDA